MKTQSVGYNHLSKFCQKYLQCNILYVPWIKTTLGIFSIKVVKCGALKVEELRSREYSIRTSMKLDYKRDLKDKHEIKVVLYSEKHAKSLDNSRKDEFCIRT